ncbi:MAG TPA: type II toxin-antitoxin system HigB family toxin [Casimicrobiaceae bacterium]|jgi:mRNA interferase HigB
MIIVGREKLDAFVSAHADTRSWIVNWIANAETAKWRAPKDIKTRYASASFLAVNVVIFNVKGKRYRLETQVAYNTGVIVIRWAVTHAAYTKRVN